jgi:ABC-2 type transport system ATP-binding protein
VAAAIAVEALRKSFGDVEALAGVSFAVEEGTVFGLLGPNGSGKTTLVRILATVLRPDGGRATILGIDVVTRPAQVRFEVGLAGQFAAVDPQLTGRENLRLVGRLAQLRPALIAGIADDLLESFGLTAAANRPVKGYSGGMRRRLDVAAALVQRPRVLFLDEPTTGLDLQSRNQLWDMIRELVRGGTTVLLTTQYLEEADQLAGRVAVMDRGRVIANDSPARLKAQFGSTILEFAFAAEELAARAAAVLELGVADRVELDRSIVRLSTQDSATVLTEALPRLQAAGLPPAHLLVRDPSLDDVFLALTGTSRAPATEPAAPDTAAANRPAPRDDRGAR